MKPQGATRRRILGDLLKTACGVGLFGLGLGLYSNRASSLPASAVCPPGAIPEDAFNGACIRCGFCVHGCPYDILYLGRVGEDIPTGTPYFIARQGACEMCEDIPCMPPGMEYDHAGEGRIGKGSPAAPFSDKFTAKDSSGGYAAHRVRV